MNGTISVIWYHWYDSYQIWFKIYESYDVNSQWIREKSTCYLYLLFCWFCFLYGGWFSYFQGKPSQNLTKSYPNRTSNEILQIFDRFGASGFALLWLSFWESIAIGWGYGGDKYLRDIGRMCQTKCHPYFKYCFQYFTPIITMVSFTNQIVNYTIIKCIRSWKVYDREKWTIMKKFTIMTEIIRSWLKVYIPGETFSRKIVYFSKNDRVLSVWRSYTCTHDRIVTYGPNSDPDLTETVHDRLQLMESA